MASESLIQDLYRLLLGRDPDHEGLEHFSGMASGEVLDAILASEEYRNRAARIADASLPATGLAAHAAARLGRRPRVVDVGAQSLDDGTHPYSPLVEFTSLDIVGFDPLSDRLEERYQAEGASGGTLTLLPYALGDGQRRRLHINNDDLTSSLYPLNEQVTRRFNHLDTLQTVKTVEVDTRRMDDVLPPGPIDFLKLDVQGAELMVLKGGSSAVARAGVIHCEVEFAPIYSGQPLFGDIHKELQSRGHYLVDVIKPEPLYHISRAGPETGDVLLWADAVFFLATSDPSIRLAQALIAAGVYGKLSLAAALLDEAFPVIGRWT